MSKRHVIILIAIALVIAAVAGWVMLSRGAPQPQPTFTLTFNSANGIAAGHAVHYQGVRIGDVTSVKPGRPTAVDVTVGSDYEPKMHRQLSFFIERVSLLGGERRVVAYDCSSSLETGPRIARGEVVPGSDSTLAWAACKASESAGPLGGAAATLLSGLATADGGRAIVDSIREYSEAAREMGQKEWETFKNDRLPALEKEALAVKERLEKEGKLEEARRFWQQFRAWVEEMLKRA
jgi:hypothetical protein